MTVFVYVAPDTDAFSLHLLRPCETKILYLETLTAFRNRPKITDFTAQHRDVDPLYECDEARDKSCAPPPLVRAHLDRYVNELVTTMNNTARRCGHIAHNGLKHFALRDVKVISRHRARVRFASDRVERTLHVLARPVADVAQADAFAPDDTVTTFSRMGSSADTAKAARRLVCHHLNATLRFVDEADFTKSLKLGKVLVPSQRCDVDDGWTSNNQNTVSFLARDTAWCMSTRRVASAMFG